ncbi:MAG: tetratricopeptide repeat protein [Nitrospiraceae bacterium]|nr:tetratricopeptide repeat protein [Nitrospiraceae bacterium]
MGKLSIFLLVLFFAALSLFAVYNHEAITFTVPLGESYEVPKFAFMLFSIAIGILISLIFFAIRDTKKYVDNWQYQKKQKQDAKVQGLYSKAVNAILAHKEDAAKDALEAILAEEHDHVDALLRLGDIYAGEEDFQKANTSYQKARMANPENLETLFALERLFEKSGRWSDALKYIDDILDIDDANLTALYRKRDILEKQGRWDDLVYLQKSILKHQHTERDRKREQESLIGYKYEYGRHSLENNQPEKSKKAFKTVLRLEKDFVPATLGLAEVMLREGESEEAVNLLEKAYESSSSKIVLARLEDLLISLGEPGRLISIYKAGISRNPNDPVTRFFLGKLYYRLEMIDDAFETLSGMEAMGISYPELHQLLGNIYMRRYQSDKAAAEYRKVIDLKKSLRLPYCCAHCGYSSDEWSGRCSRCKQWDTYQFNLDGICTSVQAGLALSK